MLSALSLFGSLSSVFLMFIRKGEAMGLQAMRASVCINAVKCTNALNLDSLQICISKD